VDRAIPGPRKRPGPLMVSLVGNMMPPLVGPVQGARLVTSCHSNRFDTSSRVLATLFGSLPTCHPETNPICSTRHVRTVRPTLPDTSAPPPTVQ
jgi:hypothetical protein